MLRCSCYQIGVYLLADAAECGEREPGADGDGDLVILRTAADHNRGFSRSNGNLESISRSN